MSPTSQPLVLSRGDAVVARTAWTGRPLRVGTGPDADLCVVDAGVDGLVAVVDRDEEGRIEVLDVSGRGLLQVEGRTVARATLSPGGAVDLPEGLRLSWPADDDLRAWEDVLEALVSGLPTFPDRLDGREVLEVSRWWNGVRIEVHHLPLDTPITLGDGLTARWSLLGVPLGDVPEDLAPVLRMSPPLASEVVSTPAHDVTLPAEALPGGRPWTLVVPSPVGPVVELPPGWPAVATDGLALAPHGCVAMDVGGSMLVVRRRPDVDRVPAPPLEADGPFVRALGVSAGLTAMLAIVSAFVPPRPVTTLVDPAGSDHPVAFHRPAPPPPAPKADAPQPDAGGGRAGGEAGRAGPPARSPDPGGGPKLPDSLLGTLGHLDRLLGDGTRGMTARLRSDLARNGRPTTLDLGGSGLADRGGHDGGGGDAESLGFGDGDLPGHPGPGAGPGFGPGKTATMGPDPIAEPVLMGGLSRDEVDRVIRRNLAAFRYCYQKRLQHDATLGGRLRMTFRIAGDGSVAHVAIAADDVGDPQVADCVSRRLYGLNFPEPRGHGHVLVTYPFLFSPG